MGNQNLFHKNSTPLPLMFCCKQKQTSSWHKFAFGVKFAELGGKNELEMLFYYCCYYCCNIIAIIIIIINAINYFIYSFTLGLELLHYWLWITECNSGTEFHVGIMLVWMPLFIRDFPGTWRDGCRESSRLFSQTLANNSASPEEPGAPA